MNTTSIPSSMTQRMLEKKSRFLIPCVYHFYKTPMVLIRGEGAWLFDDAGRRYLDGYSGVGVVNCGHCHPQIVAATQRQLHTLQHTTTIYLTEPMLNLAEALSRFVPGGSLCRSFFCTSGSEANEGALLLAKLATGRTSFIALSRALHGRTWLTTGVTGLPFWRTDPEPPQNIHFAPSPVCRSCPLGLSHPECNLRCTDAIEEILERHPGTVAAFIAEPVHGNGGIIVPPDGYFARVRNLLDRHGALLILDEAQTGFCRTGRRFAFEHSGVVPDILTLCKALGNGLPIAAFMTTDAIAATYTRPGASTFGGNLVTAEAALATLALMEHHRLEERAAQTGEHLRSLLLGLQQRFPIIAQVRGRGMMLGAELVHEDGTPAATVLDVILERMKDHGVLAGKTGPDRNVLTLMPPLILDEAQIEHLAQALDLAFMEGCRSGQGGS
ncbi:MAG: aspartate aminotransferase family protein [Magnetococcales bacterium]|nr:aspartate aminotransferase family protein [Magnetococcales bacterium]